MLQAAVSPLSAQQMFSSGCWSIICPATDLVWLVLLKTISWTCGSTSSSRTTGPCGPDNGACSQWPLTPPPTVVQHPVLQQLIPPGPYKDKRDWKAALSSSMLFISATSSLRHLVYDSLSNNRRRFRPLRMLVTAGSYQCASDPVYLGTGPTGVLVPGLQLLLSSGQWAFNYSLIFVSLMLVLNHRPVIM